MPWIVLPLTKRWNSVVLVEADAIDAEEVAFLPEDVARFRVGEVADGEEHDGDAQGETEGAVLEAEADRRGCRRARRSSGTVQPFDFQTVETIAEPTHRPATTTGR